MTTYPEERVLKPLDPPPEDVNEWPDFALFDVKVFYQGKGRYADLLEADPEVPLCVLGELMPLEDDQEHLAVIEDPSYVRMKIENVINYSFALNDDGKPVIWAAGKSGWYEIAPSDRYLNHYNDTIEAIDLFYFMVDQFSKLSQKRKRLGFQIDPFLREYQKHTDYRVDDDDEAMEILHKHHRFILKQMIEERENIDWSQTHLWNHLEETYAEEIQELRGKSSIPEEESSSEESTDESAQSRDPSEESSNDEIDWTKPIWTLLNVLRKSPTFDIKNAGIDDVASEVEKLPEFTGNHKTAFAALERSAEPLLRLMNEAKLRKKFNWSTRAIYAELEATLADEIAEEIKTPAPSKKKHRLKSVLRPSGAGKASKRSKEVIEDDDEMMEVTLPARRKTTPESVASRMDSPSRQLNGHFDLPDLPPAPEAQEMLDLVRNEAKKVGRVNQVHHLEALLGQYSEF